MDLEEKFLAKGMVLSFLLSLLSQKLALQPFVFPLYAVCNAES